MVLTVLATVAGLIFRSLEVASQVAQLASIPLAIISIAVAMHNPSGGHRSAGNLEKVDTHSLPVHHGRSIGDPLYYRPDPPRRFWQLIKVIALTVTTIIISTSVRACISNGGPGATNPFDRQQQVPGSAWRVIWRGPITVLNNTGLELDSVPIARVDGASTRADLNFDNREALGMWLYAGPALAEWSGPGVPDGKDCYEALITGRVAKVDPTPGRTLCVGTTGNQVATLQVADAQYQGVRFNAVVWRGA
jgi:hypothetical protein